MIIIYLKESNYYNTLGSPILFLQYRVDSQSTNLCLSLRRLDKIVLEYILVDKHEQNTSPTNFRIILLIILFSYSSRKCKNLFLKQKYSYDMCLFPQICKCKNTNISETENPGLSSPTSHLQTRINPYRIIRVKVYVCYCIFNPKNCFVSLRCLI